jgi:hypothetical protein
MENPNVPRTLIDGQFIPDHHGKHAEIARVNEKIGRYPFGFRHYENYEDYRHVFKKATMNDYVEDSKYSFNYLLFPLFLYLFF